MLTQPDTLQQLSERVDELEKRVTCLERQAAPALTRDTPIAPVAQPVAMESVAAPQLGSSLTMVGTSLLGIAGAYLLRALAGSGMVPRALVAGIAITYAIAWLVLAARSRSQRRFAGILYAATSTLILAPMLWEMCLRFHAMPPSIAALVVASYIVVIASLAEFAPPGAAIALAYAGSALTAFALSVATHAMAPFTAVLLAMVLLAEIASIRGRRFPVAAVVFLVADLDVWALLFIYRTPPETRADYPALSPTLLLSAPLLLFAIHAAGLALHTLARRRNMELLDAIQAMIAFALVAVGIVWLDAPISHLLLGCLCLGLSVICYALLLGALRQAENRRNPRIFAAW